MKFLLSLLFTPLMTPAEREAIKHYVRERRAQFVCEHVLADRELSERLSEIDRQLDEEGL